MRGTRHDCIITAHYQPPIPLRQFDWTAVREGREDGPVGEGRTEAEAVENLLERESEHAS
jgi:hypothetical protein